MDILADLTQQLPRDAALLSKLVAIGSPSRDAAAVTRVQQTIMAELEPLGMKCQLIPEAERGSHLLAQTSAARRSERSIHVVVHADTVHDVDPAHDHLRIDGDLPTVLPLMRRDAPCIAARGPGSLDLKGGVVCVVSALRMLAAVNELDSRPVTLFVNACEEEGTVHSSEFVRQLAANANMALVFEFGRVEDRIVTNRMGIRSYRLTVTGRAGHSGLAATSDNAIARLFRIGSKIGDWNRPDQGVRVNLGVIAGGSKVNIVADKAELEFEVRAATSAALDTIEEEARQLAATVNADLEITGAAPPMVESAASAQLRDSYAAAGRRFGLNGEAAPLQGGVSDANLFAAAGVPTIDGLGPWGDGAHTRHEFVDIASLPYKAANFVAWILGETPLL